MNYSIAYKIKVMKAYENGGQIESCPINHEQREVWKYNATPLWNWQHFSYRLKADYRNTSLLYKITVMQAFLDGKSIEGAILPQPWAPKDYRLTFFLAQNPIWDWHNYYYQVAEDSPELLES